jgi:hypothetical protein
MVIILFILASAGFTTYLLTPQKVLYNLLYLCSSIQILIYKIKNAIISKRISDTNNKNIEYSYFESVNDFKIEEFIDFKKTFVNNPELIFFKNPDSKMMILNEGIHKICYYKPFENVSSKYDISETSFISFKITIGEKEYNIRLTTPEYNFYIVNNEINHQWVKYYFNKYLNNNFIDITEYNIEIVDDNVNFINITQNDKIIFKKKTYEIVKHKE